MVTVSSACKVDIRSGFFEKAPEVECYTQIDMCFGQAVDAGSSLEIPSMSGIKDDPSSFEYAPVQFFRPFTET